MECRMMATVLVVAEEGLPLLLHMGQVLQIRILPYVGVVVLVEPFYESIAGWMIEWREDQFRSYAQGQAQDSTQDATVRKAATEASFVVYLGIVRDAQGLPSMDQELTSLLGTPTRLRLSSRAARHNIDSVEAGDGLPPV